MHKLSKGRAFHVRRRLARKNTGGRIDHLLHHDGMDDRETNLDRLRDSLRRLSITSHTISKGRRIDKPKYVRF